MPDEKPRAKLRQDIDENLKRVFDETLEEDVPDRFQLLLAKLKAKDAAEENP